MVRRLVRRVRTRLTRSRVTRDIHREFDFDIATS
jgi:hypothetical protein